jgi:hypothetical protein
MQSGAEEYMTPHYINLTVCYCRIDGEFASGDNAFRRKESSGLD